MSPESKSPVKNHLDKQRFDIVQAGLKEILQTSQEVSNLNFTRYHSVFVTISSGIIIKQSYDFVGIITVFSLVSAALALIFDLYSFRIENKYHKKLMPFYVELLNLIESYQFSTYDERLKVNGEAINKLLAKKDRANSNISLISFTLLISSVILTVLDIILSKIG